MGKNFEYRMVKKVKAPHWTREENLCIYYYLDRFPEKSDKEIAQLIKKHEQSSTIARRSESAIYQHVAQLRDRQSDLNVPDPVHNPNRSFNHY